MAQQQNVNISHSQREITPPQNPPHPWTTRSIEEAAGWCSHLFFLWTNPMIKFGYRKSFEPGDLFEVRRDEKFEYARDNFFRIRNEFKSRGNHSIKAVLMKLVRRPLILCLVLMIIGNLLQFAGPLLLKEILEFLQDPTEPSWHGYAYALGIFIAFTLRAFTMQHGYHHVNSLAFKVLAALEACIVQKCLTISTSARNFIDTGKVVNLSTVDAQGIFGFLQFFAFMITGPIMITVAMILIVLEVGAVGLSGLAVIFIGSFLNGAISSQIVKVRSQTLKLSDQRSKAIAEYISGIKIIKYYGWEKMALNKVLGIRGQETKVLLKGAIWRATLDFVTNLIPVFISLVVFGLYIAVGNTLTPPKAFTTLSLFNLIQTPIRMFAFALFYYSQTKVSLARIQHFSEWEEFEHYNQEKSHFEVGEIQITNGSFSWDTETAKQHNEEYKKIQAKQERKRLKKEKKKEKRKGKGKKKGTNGASEKLPEAVLPEKPANTEEVTGHHDTKTAGNVQQDQVIIRGINLHIKPGEFVAIVGQVGSGKSSLLSAILGEMHRISGDVGYKGKLAYVPQQGWLRNTTLRENILFGNEYDPVFYNKVLSLCELKDDCKILPGGDLTEIGEKGINLSGGQKQRVALARAVYSRADIYIIDDALSALDAHVGRKIYENVLNKILKGKTILFVTHALHYVRGCDKLVVMKDGQIVEIGTPAELENDPHSEFNKLNVGSRKEEEEEIEKTEHEIEEKSGLVPFPEMSSETEDKSSQGEQEIESKKEQETEKKEAAQQNKGLLSNQEEKAVGKIGWSVYKAYFKAGGLPLTCFAALLFLFAQGSRQVADWWVSIWSGDVYDLSSGMYVLIYFVISLITGVAILTRGIVFAFFSRKVSINLHKSLLFSIFRSPMSWFDITPSGRILSRTSKDQDDVDVNLPWTFQFAVFNVLMLISVIISIGVITPLFFAFAAVFLVYYIWLVHRFLRSSREMKRIERNAFGPPISLISEVANGYQVIRAFGQEQKFMEMMVDRMNKYLKAASNGVALQRWISLRTDLFAACVIGAAAFFGALTRKTDPSQNSSFIGLSISWALTITGIISFTIKVIADVELGMNAVERIMQYANKKEQEAPWEEPKPGPNWPSEGKFKAENVAYRYREGLPNVIHGINFSIENHEKIGVVGRTGSGKSTLTLGILRILELAEHEGRVGSIDLDNVTIANIGLHELRKKITIIPQDPILFNGTVRSNVDPFNEYSDEEVISALKKVQIWDQLKTSEEEEKKEEGNKKQENSGKSNGKRKKSSGPAEINLRSPVAPAVDEDHKKLNYLITDQGGNFSLGQRQLICMARAIIRKSKVLLMDEATASIDELTDHLIQNMIKTEFKDTTVITIAHRLITIIQYDRIMVLDQGKIVEFDTPLNLLNKEGYFSQLVKEGGPEFENKMRFFAQHKDLPISQA